MSSFTFNVSRQDFNIGALDWTSASIRMCIAVCDHAIHTPLITDSYLSDIKAAVASSTATTNAVMGAPSGGLAVVTVLTGVTASAGQWITFSNFANSANNGTFYIDASAANQVTIRNTNAVAETGSSVLWGVYNPAVRGDSNDTRPANFPAVGTRTSTNGAISISAATTAFTGITAGTSYESIVLIRDTGVDNIALSSIKLFSCIDTANGTLPITVNGGTTTVTWPVPLCTR